MFSEEEKEENLYKKKFYWHLHSFAFPALQDKSMSCIVLLESCKNIRDWTLNSIIQFILKYYTLCIVAQYVKIYVKVCAKSSYVRIVVHIFN